VSGRCRSDSVGEKRMRREGHPPAGENRLAITRRGADLKSCIVIIVACSLEGDKERPWYEAR